MKVVSMSGSLRENVGKKDAKKNRVQGMVPCVLYGGGEQIHFAVPERNFQKIIFTPEVCFVKIDVNGKEYDAILQDVQYHPVTDNILHADFLQLHENKAITMGVPVEVTGISPGVLKGGKLIQKLRKVKMKALPAHMPEKVLVDISSLDVGDAFKVGDIAIDNVSLLDNVNTLIVAVRVTRAVEEAAREAAAGEGDAKDKKPEKK